MAPRYSARLPAVLQLRDRRHGRLVLGVSLVGLVLVLAAGLRISHAAAAPANIVTAVGQKTMVDLSDPDAPFVAWPLARACRETRWVPGLVFACDNNSGDVGSMRNYILTCIRYAIEAGASSLVMPHIESRSADNLTSLLGGPQPLGYFFDEAHFRASLAVACPQIQLHDSITAVPRLNRTKTGARDGEAEKITPHDFGLRGGCDQKDLNRHADLFGPRFRAWLATTAILFNVPPVSLRNPRLVRFTRGVQWDWPVWTDGPELANTFGGLLRIRPDVLQLGRKVEAAMRQVAQGTRSGGARGQDGRFIGFHLRTDYDTLASWPRYDVQATVFLREASRRGLGAAPAYLVTGNASEGTRFAEQTALHNRGLRVLTKQRLLDGQENGDTLKQLQSLTWDQQALVDFVVLLRCDYFVGVSPSPFSINVAGKRHLRQGGIYTRPWRVGREGDGRSFLIGYYEGYWDNSLFMYDSLWP